ncbi:MAG: PQQ-binding-like beta-propeller repeat protein, partial [Planctomycetaceae bacterium]|nr:PQQ-binding-like beta-propeller repeat protein [Planctomycetaceae bacterium]
STNGRMFIQGTDKVMAYDAYNGTFLWDYENPGAVRTGVFNNRETHNLAAGDDVLYVAVQNRCTGLDAATGKVVREFQTPETRDGIERAWAYIAFDGGQLFGSSTIRKELEQRLRRRGLTVSSQTDALFAIGPTTGETQWTYRGANILHTTIALSPDAIFFIDSSISPEERQELYRREKPELQNLTGDAAKAAEEEMKKLDVRLAVALNRRTGEKLWERPVNVTDTTEVSAGGGSLTVMYADDCLVLCGANANGHYWKQFLSGEFEKRKLVVLDAATGRELWSKNANYMNRPAVIEGQVFAEPWAFDLRTGEPKTRNHPLTGESDEWRFSRPGHHCGVITATPNMMFFRSGFIGYYDLYQDSGTRHFSGQRLGCWINAIPGNGLVMIPEASAGCVCQFSIASTVVLEPKTENNSWGIFSAVGKSTPVKRLGINFGGPGDRKDDKLQEWFGYPRPHTVGRLEYVFDLKPQLVKGGSWYSDNPESVSVTTIDAPWLFASGVKGLQRFTAPLLGEGDAPARYDLKLYFTGLSPDDAAAVKVRAQGQDVTGQTEVSTGDGPHALSVVLRTFSGLAVDHGLTVELASPEGAGPANLAAAEIVRSAEAFP